MNSFKRPFWSLIGTAMLCGTVAACGGSDGGDIDQGTPGQVTVNVSAPNGDPISGATVWTPSGSSLQALRVVSGSKKLTDEQGNNCADVPEPASSSACSNADGTAILECTGEGTFTIKFSKGSFSGTMSATCGQAATVPAAFSATGSLNAAVVTGTFDKMEDVLAKLGYGDADENGHLVLGSENFNIYDGNNTLDDGTYMNFGDVLTNSAELAKNDIIFINCDEFGQDDQLDTDTVNKLANLRQYVLNGGKLYVTDLSYDYVEQAFPNYVNFSEGGVGGPAPETLGAAETGSEPEDPNANVDNADMRSWLSQIRVNTGTPGADCGTTEINGKVGAMNQDGSIYISDLLGGWALIDGSEGNPDGLVTRWIQGTNIECADRPLTVTFEVGNGRVLYTSYHTAENCPTTGFWPQERVLQYLIFEL